MAACNVVCVHPLAQTVRDVPVCVGYDVLTHDVGRLTVPFCANASDAAVMNIMNVMNVMNVVKVTVKRMARNREPATSVEDRAELAHDDRYNDRLIDNTPPQMCLRGGVQ
jgi:hypothetical protein